MTRSTRTWLAVVFFLGACPVPSTAVESAPVNPAWRQGQTLIPPGLGFSIAAPPGWDWLDASSTGEHRDFVAADPSTGRYFIVSWLADESRLNAAFFDQFIAGLQHSVESSGGRFAGLIQAPSAIPAPGSLQFRYTLTSPRTDVQYVYGFLAAGPHLIFLQHVSPKSSQPDDFLAFASSLRRAARKKG